MLQVNSGFTQWKKKGVRFLTIPAFERAGGVVCAFSTRIGGVSPPPFDTLNFSRKREPNEAHFQENMRRFGEAVGFNSQHAVLDNYEHGVALYQAKAEDAGRGIVREALPVFCDGLFTDETELPLVSLHADCVPLFFYDPVRRMVAVCHAGWRGVSGHMVLRTVEALRSMGCRPENLLGAVGPCISVRRYEVGEEVRDIFSREFGSGSFQEHDGSIYADLTAACVTDMTRAGMGAANITVSDLCTYENPYLFYSHRRDRGKTGAMAAVIILRSPQ
jgi:YfiH family protein